ncbi:hypothetical protein Agub_g1540, partial [Astrephomene gubernaculifera]
TEASATVVPVPVVQHFLEDIRSHGSYQGFPTLGIQWKRAESQALRRYVGMRPEQTGIVITSLNPTAPLASLAQPLDVLAEVAGARVDNEGGVELGAAGEGGEGAWGPGGAEEEEEEGSPDRCGAARRRAAAGAAGAGAGAGAGGSAEGGAAGASGRINLTHLISSFQVGAPLQLTLLRQGQPRPLTLRLSLPARLLP